MMEDMKVSLESLYTNKVKEIDYDGEEHYQERSSLSQHVTELAQRVDFSEVAEGKEGEPAVKKAIQKWPWEQPHSKLKQALTEVSVLSDMLHVLHDHRHYMAMDTVAPPPPPSLPLAYQYLLKKKALARAADILKRGTEALTHSSSREERAFHRALGELRRRWRVRRSPTGSIVGDLGYSTAGSTHVPQSRAIFEVKKAAVQESPAVAASSGGQSSATEEQPQEKESLSVTIFRELRGKSEVVIFLSSSPVRVCESLSVLGSVPHVPPRRPLPSWEVKVLAAQNIIFNQELFSQLTREAYNTKTVLPYEVLSNKIIVPLSLNPPLWLSILHIRDYGDSKTKPKEVVLSVPTELPPVRWDLVIAAKQLLRQKHLRNLVLYPPRPTSARYTDNLTLQNAGANALSETQIKAAEKKDNVFQSLLKMAKHMHNEERLRQWLVEMVGSSWGDPVLKLHWIPNLSMTETSVYLHIKSEGDSSHSVHVQLSVDTVTVRLVEGGTISCSMDKEKLLRVLRHQVVVYQMFTACQVAEKASWIVLQSFTRPQLSSALARGSGSYLEACNILLQSPDAHNKLDILLEWKQVSVSQTQTVVGEADSPSLPTKFKMDSKFGQSFYQRFTNLLGTMA